MTTKTGMAYLDTALRTFGAAILTRRPLQRRRSVLVDKSVSRVVRIEGGAKLGTDSMMHACSCRDLPPRLRSSPSSSNFNPPHLCAQSQLSNTNLSLALHLVIQYHQDESNTSTTYAGVPNPPIQPPRSQEWSVRLRPSMRSESRNTDRCTAIWAAGVT